ncbi:MAG: helix-turn-helix transcriptional regulator [Bacteroidetes bacterium]|nr:helix-turn-helix transcriptional regulator [Bacteroidota bacterium]
MDTDITTRLNLIIENYGLTKKSFAELTKISQPIVTHITTGRNFPGLDVLQKILISFPDLNPDWLILGVEPMKRPGIEESNKLKEKQIKLASRVKQAHQLLYDVIQELEKE